MKYLKLFFIFLLIFLLPSCAFDNPKYINLKSKPNLHYYSEEVYSNVKGKENFTLEVFDCNFYEYYTVNDEDMDIVPLFFESLNNDNYIAEYPEDIKNPKYKLIITFTDSKDSKYVINIYNKNFVTLFPWDGNFIEDMITMNGVSEYNNLYSFCKYIINKAHNMY